jgi:hypothetical protein
MRLYVIPNKAYHTDDDESKVAVVADSREQAMEMFAYFAQRIDWLAIVFNKAVQDGTIEEYELVHGRLLIIP